MVELRALITGISGFAGSHLADYLANHTEMEVSGITRNGSGLANLSHLAGRVTLYRGDILSPEFVQSTISQAKPHYVFHLAAQAAPALSWSEADKTLINNTLGQLYVLQTLVAEHRDCRVLVVGSAEEYGAVRPSELPIDEATALRPNNPYAVSKITQDMLGLQFYVSHKLPVVRVRPFNHVGSRQNDSFVCSSFARQIAEIELGLREPVLKVGNLEARRDFTDVGDMVRAYWLAISQGEPGEVYNIGSGTAHSISDVLRSLLEKSHTRIRVEQDPARLRPSDVAEIYCNYSRFHQKTGWKPLVPLEKSLSELLDYWRQRLSPKRREQG